MTHLHAHVQKPYAGTVGDSSENISPTHDDLDFGPFKLDPTIEVRCEAPTSEQVWGVWVTTSSDKIDHKWSDEGVPLCKVTVPAYKGGPTGSEYGPNPAISSLSVSVETRVTVGADQIWLGKLSWALPDIDSYWPQVREWRIDIMNPALADDPGTPDDERILWSRRIPSYLTSLTLDWRRIEDSEPDYLLLVRPVDDQGRVNSYVPGVTAAIAVRPRLVPSTAGTEYCALITGLSLAGNPYYEQDQDTGAYVLRVPLMWPIPADARYGGALFTCHRADGTIEDWPVVPRGSLPRPTGREDPRIRTSPQQYGYFTATIRRLPTASEDLLFHAFSVDANGRQNSYVYGTTPSLTVTVQPRTAAQRVANVTGFSVASAYAPADSDGFRPLLLTPTFTVPDDPAFAYVDFWAYRTDTGKWHLLGYPSKGGVVDVATIYQTPAADGNWVFKAIAHDVNGKDRDGKVNSDPANPPDGTPSFTLHIDPLAAGTAGTEWTDNVISFAGGGAGGAAIEYRTNADGVEQWRVCLTWTRPASTTFGGIKPVVRFNPGTSEAWDNPLGYTGPDEPLPWRSGWFDMGASATADIYAVGVAVAGQRENTIVPGVTPRITGLTIEPQTDGALKGGRVDTAVSTLKVKKADSTVFLEIGKIDKGDGTYHYGLKASDGTFSVVIDPDGGVVITDTATNSRATLTNGQLAIIEDLTTVFSNYAAYKKDGWNVNYTPQNAPAAGQEQVISVAPDNSVMYGDRLVAILNAALDYWLDSLGNARLKTLDVSDGLSVQDTPGVDLTSDVLNWVTPVTTTIAYRDWAGNNCSATVVTGIDVSGQQRIFRKGLLVQ
jgi:hypothetical protein